MPTWLVTDKVVYTQSNLQQVLQMVVQHQWSSPPPPLHPHPQKDHKPHLHRQVFSTVIHNCTILEHDIDYQDFQNQNTDNTTLGTTPTQQQSIQTGLRMSAIIITSTVLVHMHVHTF